MTAFYHYSYESIVLEMLQNPVIKREVQQSVDMAICLRWADVWEWKEVEMALITENIESVFAITDDRRNYITRLALNGRKASVIRVLKILEKNAQRLKEAVGETAESRSRAYSINTLAEIMEVRTCDVHNVFGSTADLGDDLGIFYHLLHICAQQDWEDVVEVLEKRFDIRGLSGGDHVGRTMLHWAVENSWSYALRDFGNRPQRWLDHQDRDGMTAMHLACQTQNHDVVRHLIKSGASYLLRDKYGRTPGL